MFNTNNNMQTQTSSVLHNSIMEEVMETYTIVSANIKKWIDAEAEVVETRFVTLVKRSQELKTVSYHKIYDIMKQHQNEVNEIRAERLIRTANLLALVAQQKQPGYYPQPNPTHYTQSSNPTHYTHSSSTISQATTRNKEKAVAIFPPPIYDPEPKVPTNNNLKTSSNTRNVNADNTLIFDRRTGYERQTGQYDNHRAINVVGARENVDQELEEHYIYMEKIQEVTPDAADNSRPIFDVEPLKKVHNSDDDYNVFANDRQHPEQPISVHETYLVEQGYFGFIQGNLTLDNLRNRSRFGINKWYQSFALRNFDLEDMEFESANSNTTSKLPILKLENGNLWVSIPQKTQENGTSVTKISVPVTAEEKTNKKNDVKARSLLLMALPNGHQLTFSFRRLSVGLQSWPEVDTMSIDDLYNNIKIVKQKVKKSVGTSSGAQNLAFMTAPSTSSTNDANTASPQVSTASPNVNTASPQVNTASFSDNAVYAFMVENPNGSNLLHQDLEQIHKDDLEAMDLKWQLSLLSIRAKRYYQRIGKKIFINANDTAGYDKSKVECFNCLKTGHFARKCKAPRSKEGAVPPPILLIHNRPKSLIYLIMVLMNSKELNSKVMGIAHNKDDTGFVDSGAHGGRISGKGTLKTDSLDFEDVYFVNELKFNLFSVSQMCDKKNYVLFTDTECLVLSPNFKLPDESQILLKIPRKDNMYSFDMKNIVPKESLTCLVAKATSDESMLWHRRLGHINFKNINKLVKDNLVRGLPTKRFENDQTCVACLKGKQHRASCKSKVLNPITKPLFMLHMDLFGPTFVSSLMHKKYCLVVTDDYSRFTWVFFLTTKDETSEILKNFIKEIENLVDKKVKIIRSDNGTEFKNKVMDDFCREKGIRREYSVARTLQQNGVAERRNRTLIEAARTMLADSKLPTTFWAEAVSTACYVQNRVLVVKPNNKTPYELFRGFKPALTFMRLFGCHVTILNTLDSLGKFDGKSDKGTQGELNVGTSEEISQDCIVMPIWKDASYFDSPSKDVDNGEPKSAADDQKQDEDNLNNESDDKDNPEDNSSPKEANVAGQHVNTASPEINTGTFKLNTVDPSVNTASSNDLNRPKDMFTLGASHSLEVNHVEFFSDEDEPEVDLGNIPNSYPVPTTPHISIHKDHPFMNVIGDVKSSIQTRRMTQNTNEQGFISDVYEGKTHEDLYTCLFTCFLSQEEPKRISKAPSDPAWVEAMQEELLVEKLEKHVKSGKAKRRARIIQNKLTKKQRVLQCLESQRIFRSAAVSFILDAFTLCTLSDHLSRCKIDHPKDEDAAADSSKQERKISDIDEDPNVSLVQDDGMTWFEEDAQVQEKQSDDTEVIVQEETPTEIIEEQSSGGKDEKEVSTAGAELSTGKNGVNSASGSIGTAAVTYCSEIDYCCLSVDEELARKIQEEEQARAIAEQEQERINFEAALELQRKLDERQEVLAQTQEIDWNTIAEQLQEKYGWIQNGYFKGMSYDDIRPIFEVEYNKVQTLFRNKYVEEEKGQKVLKEFAEKTETEQGVKEISKKTRGMRRKYLARKRTREAQDEDTSKRQKHDEEEKADNEEEKLKLNFEYQLLGRMEAKYMDVYKLTRADGSSSYHGNLKMIFEPDENNEIWKTQSDWKLLSWKLHENCGVHTLFLDGTPMEINMLVEKKYHRLKEILEKMLNLHLEAEAESTMAFELLKFVKSQIEEQIDQILGSTSGIRAYALRNFDLEVMEFESAQNNTTAKLPILKLDTGTSVTKMSVPITAKEKICKKNDVKARSLLLMALSNEHQLTFCQYSDAKTMFDAIKTRFGGLQSWLNKADIETISIDDLYNNFKIVEQDVKKSVGASTGAQKLAFITTPSTSSTNDINTANSACKVSTVSPNINTASSYVSTSNISDNVVYAFMVKNPNGSNLLQQDLEQIYEDDLEAMDLKWQLSLLSMKAKRY
ncbi:putative ribonuclease H-like domain-containing protein [Tanacetum coccineum]